MDEATSVPAACFSIGPRSPELLLITLKDHCPALPVFDGPYTEVPLTFAAMNTTTQIAEINLQPSQVKDYSAYVPVRLGNLMTAAFIDSGNTFANVITLQTMTNLGISTAQLEPGSTPALRGHGRCWEENEYPRASSPHRPPAGTASGQVPHPSSGPTRPRPPCQHLWPLLSSCWNRSDSLEGGSKSLWQRRTHVFLTVAVGSRQVANTSSCSSGLYTTCIRNRGTSPPVYASRTIFGSPLGTQRRQDPRTVPYCFASTSSTLSLSRSLGVDPTTYWVTPG